MTQSSSNNNQGSKARVTRTSQHRSPEAVRRLGRALIALARAQLEAEAEAQSEAKAVLSGRASSIATTPGATGDSKSNPPDVDNATTGDAA